MVEVRHLTEVCDSCEQQRDIALRIDELARAMDETRGVSLRLRVVTLSVVGYAETT